MTDLKSRLIYSDELPASTEHCLPGCIYSTASRQHIISVLERTVAFLKEMDTDFVAVSAPHVTSKSVAGKDRYFRVSLTYVGKP